MPFRVPSSCYRKLLIGALTVLACVSGNNAFAEPVSDGEAKQEASKNSDPPVDKAQDKKEEAQKGGEVKADDQKRADAEVRPYAAEAKAKSAGEATTEGQVKSAGAGAAEEAAKSGATESHSEPEWHRVQVRLSGSLCYACLKDLEDSLEKIPGVWRAKIDRAKPNYFSAVSPEIQSYAEGVILVDEKRLPLENLRTAIKQNAYHSYKVLDKVLARHPDEKDLKW